MGSYNYEPSETTLEATTASLHESGLEFSWSCPFALGTLACYRDAAMFGVLVYWDRDCEQGRIYRPVLPPGATFEAQVAEAGRSLAAERTRARMEADRGD